MDEPRWRTFAFYFLCCNLTLAAIAWGITNEFICMGLAVRSAARVEGVRAEVALCVFECDEGAGTYLSVIPPLPGE